MKESMDWDIKERSFPIDAGNDFKEYIYDYEDNCFEKDLDAHWTSIIEETEKELNDKSKQV